MRGGIYISKRKFLFILVAGITYIVLLHLLIVSESASSDADITTFGDALWYSLVTLTTVGYGDLSPVTIPGRVIGAVFLILSTGVLALLFGLAFSLLTGRLFPHLRLWRNRRRKWYMFYPDNEASRSLASAFTGEYTIFCGAEKTSGSRSLYLKEMPDSLMSLPFFGQCERILFLMSENVIKNEHIARSLAGTAVQIYCRGGGLNEALPDNITRFNQFDCAARLYWQLQPCSPAGEQMIIIGSGRFASSLLNQGLLVAPPGCTIELFGSWTEWRAMHDAVQELPESIIRLHFHAENWAENRSLISEADRIILCADDELKNRDVLRLLKMYYVIKGQIHVRSIPGLQKAFYFGTQDMLFTPELVMRQTQNDRAQALHEMYRRQADYPVPTWSELSDFLKHSNLAAADHLLTKIRILLPDLDVREVTAETCAKAAAKFESASLAEREWYRSIEHNRWLIFHALYNWQYAEHRNDALRLHPLMVNYDTLSEADRQKDDSAWLQLGILAEEGDL